MEENNEIALLIAVENKNIDLVQLFLSNNEIDVNTSNEHVIEFNDYDIENDYTEKITPIYLAVDKENIEIIKLLLNNEKIELNCLNKVASYNKKESPKENSEEEEKDNDFKPHDIHDHFMILLKIEMNIEILISLL